LAPIATVAHSPSATANDAAVPHTAAVRGCRHAPTIYLVGRFDEPYSRPTVTKSLSALGFDVVDAANQEVTLVLTGADPFNDDATDFVPVESLPEFKDAVARGARVMRLREIRQTLIRL
jgi:hypothetical protein